jgi:hypothetical protein
LTLFPRGSTIVCTQHTSPAALQIVRSVPALHVRFSANPPSCLTFSPHFGTRTKHLIRTNFSRHSRRLQALTVIFDIEGIRHSVISNSLCCSIAKMLVLVPRLQARLRPFWGGRRESRIARDGSAPKGWRGWLVSLAFEVKTQFVLSTSHHQDDRSEERSARRLEKSEQAWPLRLK